MQAKRAPAQKLVSATASLLFLKSGSHKIPIMAPAKKTMIQTIVGGRILKMAKSSISTVTKPNKAYMALSPQSPSDN
jgi:hypothetical protein